MTWVRQDGGWVEIETPSIKPNRDIKTAELKEFVESGLDIMMFSYDTLQQAKVKANTLRKVAEYHGIDACISCKRNRVIIMKGFDDE